MQDNTYGILIHTYTYYNTATLQSDLYIYITAYYSTDTFYYTTGRPIHTELYILYFSHFTFYRYITLHTLHYITLHYITGRLNTYVTLLSHTHIRLFSFFLIILVSMLPFPKVFLAWKNLNKIDSCGLRGYKARLLFFLSQILNKKTDLSSKVLILSHKYLIKSIRADYVGTRLASSFFY